MTENTNQRPVGCDIQILLIEEGKETTIFAEKFSYKKKIKDGVPVTTGKVKIPLVDGSKGLMSKEARIVVSSINEYGVCDTLFDEEVAFTSVSLSTDTKKDISVENYTFAGISE
jgi:hypothetical protein